MKNFFRVLFFILIIPLLYAFIAQTALFVFEHFTALWSNWFIYGALGYAALYAVVLWAKLGFLETFEHEAAHMIVGYLFFHSIKHFRADWRNWGYVEFDRVPNTIVILAPYFFPVFTVPFLLIKPFMTVTTHHFINFFLGLTLAFHLIPVFREFSPRQSDIYRVGLKSAFIIVFVLNCIFIVITMGFALEQYAAVGAYFKEAFVRAWKIYLWGYMKLFNAPS